MYIFISVFVDSVHLTYHNWLDACRSLKFARAMRQPEPGLASAHLFLHKHAINHLPLSVLDLLIGVFDAVLNEQSILSC